MSQTNSRRVATELLVAVSFVVTCRETLARTGPEMAPVPNEAAQKQAQQSVDEVYKDAIQKAKTPAQRIEIGDQLAKDGLGTEDNAAVRFVLLRSAFDLMLRAGEFQRALQISDQLLDSFDLKRSALRGELVLRSAKSVKGSSARLPLLSLALQVADEAIAEEDFEGARQLCDFAIAEAKTRKDPALVKQSTLLKDRVAQWAKARRAAEEGLSVLEREPDNAEANLKVGEFRCFVQGDWTAGLPLLARSDDIALKSLARRELSPTPPTPEQQLKLADDWWETAEQRTADYGVALQGRAGYWYRRALPTANGLNKVLAQKRLASLPPAATTESTDEAPATESPIRTIRFQDSASLEEFVLRAAPQIEATPQDVPRTSNLWRVDDGHLLIKSKGISQTTQVVLKRPYARIDELTIKGRIVPPNRHNFRFSVGRIKWILNWEMGDKSLVLTGKQYLRETPSLVMTPGRLHTIALTQVEDNIVLSVDGKEISRVSGELVGALTLYADEGTTIAIEELVIQGEPADGPAKDVSLPKR